MRKSIRKGELLSTDDAEHAAVFVLSTSALDRDGETVDPAGGDFREYERNPVVLFNHDADDFPIGRSAKLWVGEVQGKPALLGKVVFSQANPKGQLAYQMVKEGTLKGCSISFLPTGRVERNRSGGNHYGSWKLLEWSVCPVGSNPDAVRLCAKRLKGAMMARQLWTKGSSAWLLKAEGEPDDEMQAYLTERQLDDVRLEEEPPPAEEGWEEVAAAVGEAVGEAVAEVLAGTEEPSPEEPAHKQEPSAEIDPEKACQILEDGQVNGAPLTEEQRAMFGAACSRAQKHFRRCQACRSRKWLCPSCTSILRKSLKAMSGDEFKRRVEELQRLRDEGTISQQEFERRMEQVHREYLGIAGKGRKQDAPPREPDEEPLPEEPLPEENLPPGRQAVERWIGMIERDLRGLEQPQVVAAAEKALAAFQAALGKAYGEGEEPDALLDEAQEKKLADLVDRLEQNEARISEALFRGTGKRLV